MFLMNTNYLSIFFHCSKKDRYLIKRLSYKHQSQLHSLYANRSYSSTLAFSTCGEGHFIVSSQVKTSIWLLFVNEIYWNVSQRLEREIHKTIPSPPIFEVTRILSLETVLQMCTGIFPCHTQVPWWQTLRRYTDGTSISPWSLVILHLFPYLTHDPEHRSACFPSHGCFLN